MTTRRFVLPLLIAVFLPLLLLGPAAAYAQSTPPASSSGGSVLTDMGNAAQQTGEAGAGLKDTGLTVTVLNIIKMGLGLLGTIFVILVLYAGFLWMTAGGNEEQVGKAKKLILNAAVGLVIILSSEGITWFIGNRIQQATIQNSQWQLNSGNIDLVK